LAGLVRSQVITMEEAFRNSDHQEDLRLKLSGMVGGGQRDMDAGAVMGQGGNQEQDVLLNESGVSVESVMKMKPGAVKRTG
jgi:hypothetical protein